MLCESYLSQNRQEVGWVSLWCLAIPVFPYCLSRRQDPSSPGLSHRGVGQRWPAAGLGALGVAVSAWDLLKEVTIIFTISTKVWPQVK